MVLVYSTLRNQNMLVYRAQRILVYRAQTEYVSVQCIRNINAQGTNTVC